jgi:chemotaxis signal transduction protein
MSLNGRTSEKATLGPSLCYVVVTMGGRLFAFDADSFRGALTIEEAAGQVVSADGTVYPPLALADLLGLSPNEDSSDRRVLLLTHQDRCGSVAVDRVHGQVACHPSEIVPFSLHFHGTEREWYQGMILFQESVALILNLSWVICGTQPDHSTRQSEWSMDSVPETDSTGAMAKVQKC